ncbi:FKBP-type peptidyl-prolyl cis-trans isomerase [Desertivirga xinjiangensis]|uniref:FKBP-type peptidyl-prolyl cis-trans isomerase n=1 Tax=Desertivirga xinjiangensis TaxID=539206 RepID=UPI00210BCD12|nr:FKBP-type peptidyl-prolyl cis-trans isomerase [Pedobacter xinjiangensis]
MKRNLIVLGLAALAFTSCKQFKKGEGDLQYIIHEDKDGATIKEGDFLSLKVTQKTEEDSVMYESAAFDRPALLVQQKPAFKGDLYSAIGMLSEGDSATFKINLDSMQTKMGMPKPTNTKGKYLLFSIRVDKVIPKGKMNDQQMQAKVETYMKGETEKAKNKEAGIISNYISSNDLKPTVTASGLNYVVTQQGSGAKPAVGDTVEVNYTGKFITGKNKVFDTSVKEVAEKEKMFDPMRPYKPIKVAAGTNGTIPGFDEALLLLNKGAKATVLIPSKLGYGAQGSQVIGPYTPLLFELEVVNVIKQTPGSAPAGLPQIPAQPPVTK